MKALCGSLNPRFDGAFLNYETRFYGQNCKGLNPRFDGAFLNYIVPYSTYLRPES